MRNKGFDYNKKSSTAWWNYPFCKGRQRADFKYKKEQNFSRPIGKIDLFNDHDLSFSSLKEDENK